MTRHASKSYRNQIDQRLIGLSKATRDKRRLQALSSKSEKFPSYMKPSEKRELLALRSAYPCLTTEALDQ